MLNMIMGYRALVSALLLAAIAAGQTSLSGDIGGMTLDSTGNPFIVADNLTIPAGKTTIIGEGCVLLFKAFTGMVVYGSLKAKGTLNHPVVFTSANDQRYNPSSETPPQPFDWNGVYVTEESEEVSLSNFVLAFSVYGVKSEKEMLSLNNATFNANGQFHFTVNDSIARVTDGVPYSYVKTEEPIEPQPTPEISKKPESKSGGPSLVLPITTGATGVVAGIGAAASFISGKKTHNDYLAESDPVRQNDIYRKHKLFRGAGFVLSAVAAAAIPTSVILFLRPKRTAKDKVAIQITPGLSPDFEPVIHMGVAVTLGGEKSR
ncbi:MAG: hypothetical protein GF344_16365 [Chitinivibrionales bacterium]|nr:hypothetical protein [Chitinivibrionales bacterium]MBD3358272.1 hypothetical protein [Chitinivibrionales bacterium]